MEKKKTFTHPLKYKEYQPDFSKNPDNPDFSYQTIHKEIEFVDLDEFDRDQHDLHFLIMGHFIGGGAKAKGRKKLVMDPEFSHEVTVMFIEEMAVTDEKAFTIKDREILLNDSAALISFSLWLMPNKILPFFLELMKDTGS